MGGLVASYIIHSRTNPQNSFRCRCLSGCRTRLLGVVALTSYYIVEKETGKRIASFSILQDAVSEVRRLNKDFPAYDHRIKYYLSQKQENEK